MCVGVYPDKPHVAVHSHSRTAQRTTALPRHVDYDYMCTRVVVHLKLKNYNTNTIQLHGKNTGMRDFLAATPQPNISKMAGRGVKPMMHWFSYSSISIIHNQAAHPWWLMGYPYTSKANTHLQRRVLMAPAH